MADIQIQSVDSMYTKNEIGVKELYARVGTKVLKVALFISYYKNTITTFTRALRRTQKEFVIQINW